MQRTTFSAKSAWTRASVKFFDLTGLHSTHSGKWQPEYSGEHGSETRETPFPSGILVRNATLRVVVVRGILETLGENESAGYKGCITTAATAAGRNF